MAEMKYFNLVNPGSIFIDDSIATEAVSTVMDVNGEPMKIFLCTDKIITDNKIPQVTNPVAFVRGAETTPDGIFSEIIFGNTQKEKVLNHGYISLKKRFFHPYVFETLCALHTKVEKVCTGESSWTIVDGKLKEVTDETDPAYNMNNTGLQFIIDNYDKLRIDKNESILHNDKVALLKSLTKDELFITKFLVIPRFYRDFTMNGSMKSVQPINNMYNQLISLSNSLENGLYGYMAHKSMYLIQKLMVDIRQYGQKLIEKKNGTLHKDVLGKNVTYGGRAVISVPSFVGCDYPDDCQVNMLYTGLPLAKCIETGYPFVIKWLLDWVERELSGGPFTIYRKNDKGLMEPFDTRLKNHVNIFDKGYLDKRLNMFLKGYGGRFEPVYAETEDGEKVFLSFTGRGYSRQAGSEEAATIANRPLTWCDLIYMASEDTLSDKHVYCTRYPAEDYFNITPSRVSVLSTIKTMPMMVNGKLYKHYPVINPFESEINVSRSFIDTLSVSNLHLGGYRGDYDGDTLSIKMCYTQEANEEAEEKIHSLSHYMTINGDIIRRLSNEATLCMYNMTRRAV